MRCFLRATFTVFLAVITTAAGAQDFRHTYSEGFRRPAFDVAIGDGVVWVADGYGVTVATRENPPRLMASTALDGTTTRLAMQDGKAWIVSGKRLIRASWSGEEIVVEDVLDLDEEVFDIAGARGFLYLATASGIVQIDAAIPGSGTVLQTTSGVALSLATDGKTLIAADGDDTADVYNIEFPVLPQKIGVAELSIPGGSSVYDVGGTLLVSNGRDSELFGSLRPPFTSLGVFPFGASSAGTTSPGIVFSAGQDTTVRLVDVRLSAGRPAVLFEERLAPSAGTINRISRIRSDGNLVYLAAGDLGLQTYDIIDFGVPFPIVRSFVGRADRVVDLGNGQIVASSNGAVPRLYTIDSSGALRETSRWEDQHGVTALDHIQEVTLVAQAGTARLVRPSGAVTGQFSFNAAISGGVVIDDEIWVVLSDRTLWRAPVTGGQPEKVSIPGATPSFVARGAGRFIVGTLNDDGSTTVHDVDRADPSQSASITIPGAATSGAAVSGATVAVATFRGLSLLDVSGAKERLVSLGASGLPRALEAVGDEIIVLASSRLQRRKVSDGSLISELPLLSSGLALSIEDSSTRVIVGADGGIYTVDLASVASQPLRLGRLRESLFFEDVLAKDHAVHILEDDTVWSRILQNQRLSSTMNVIQFEGDIIGIATTRDGFCGLDSRGRLDCFDHAGRLGASGEIAALDDASFLSIHSVRDAVLVSLLEGCFGAGCRKRTVMGTIASGVHLPGSEIEGEIVALSASGQRFAVVTELPRELRLYEIADASASPTLIASTAIDTENYAIALDDRRNAVYLIGQRVTAYALPSLNEIGVVLESPDPGSGFSVRDQRIAIEGDRALVIGRSPELRIYRLEGPASWVLERSIPLPSMARRMVRSGTSFVILTDFSIEIVDSGPPVERRRPTR